jgi:hypothetical protein
MVYHNYEFERSVCEDGNLVNKSEVSVMYRIPDTAEMKG